MSGVPGRSGGHNRKSIEAHVLAGTFRKDRHAIRPVEAPPISPADRRRTLQGLTPGARRLAGRLLDAFAGWEPSSLTTLRSYARSCERLEALESAADVDRQDVAREVRVSLGLLKALNLEVIR